MDKNPLVSIIIPVYNGSNYLKEAIDSALGQTYSNIEVIVVNDGSTDEGKTEKIALEYEDKIKYIKKENGGVSSALNVGIQNMKGEYFSWLSHDDVYEANKIEKQIDLMKKHDKWDVVVKSFTCFIDKDSVPIKYKGKTPNETTILWDDAIIYVIREGMNGCTLLIPKDILSAVGCFDERLRYCQDTLMWWKIFLMECSLMTCNHIGVYSRIHENQLTRTGSELYHHDAKLIGDEMVPKFKEKSRRDKNLLYEYARSEAIHGNREVVLNCIYTGEENGLIQVKEKVMLFFYLVYGRIRPIIRYIYYKIVHGIQVK